MESKVLISILLCLFVIQLNAQSVTITSSSPSKGNINGRQVIAVTGCGFRQFNQAVCTWDFEYYSPIHVILGDELIYCETPKLTRNDFDVLPKITSLYVVFDGDRSNTYLVNSNFRFGPSVIAYTPSYGFVNGGEEFRIIGDGFSEFDYVNVTFDAAQCINTTILNDNEITCVVPPGEFNQNAIVDLRFEDSPNYYLHFEKTYHYGPILYGISPPCGLVTGGTRVTILGINLDDPFIAYGADPANVTPEVEVIYNNGGNRLFGLDIEFDPKNNLVSLTTPNIGGVFGEQAQFAVFFKKVFSKVAVTVDSNFIYGPIIYNSLNNGNFLTPIQNPSSSSGSLGGGENINIYGCGLSQFNNTQYQVYFNDELFCAPGSLQVVTLNSLANEYLTCTVNPLSCGPSDNTGQVYVRLNADLNTTVNTDPQTLPPSYEAPLAYQAGPILNANTMTSFRGPRTGNQLVSIYGENLFYSANNNNSEPGWSVTVNFNTSDNSVIIPSVPATFISNDQLSFVTPIGLFDLDVTVSFDFGTTCTGYPRTSAFPSYHFGPVCNEVTPVNGHWSGGSMVTIIGEGFEEDDNIASDTYVRLCIERLSTPNYCAYEESPRDSFSLNDTRIIFVTPSARQNVLTNVGDNRLFGDVAEVYIHFYEPGGVFVDIPRNQLRPGLDVAKIYCPNPYTFAPKVETVTPNNGQVVTRVNPVNLPVTVNGEFLDDPNLQNDVIVTFDGLLTVSPSITSDNTITSEITWGLTAGTDSTVGVIFDTGNRTYSGINIGFGPAIYSLATSKLGDPIISEYNPNGDVYGLFPVGGETVIVYGEGFAEYSGSIECTIGGNSVETTLINDTVIYCTTPCKPFGARVQLTINFGQFCGADEINWENSVTASQYLYYNPRIDTFTPAFGKTSGGDTVTISGEGFSGWGKYECFFGHYSDQQHMSPSSDGTTIVCNTPINRAEFNTYVTVHIQLSAYDDDDTVDVGYIETDQRCNPAQIVTDESIYAGVEDHDFKVWASNKFYYGPVCSDISPSSCSLAGCNASVVGTGFQDCITKNQTVYTKTYPYNDCIFRYYKVRFVDPVTKEVTYVNAPTNDTLDQINSNTALSFFAPANNCGYEPEIEIEFFSPSVSTPPSSDGLQSQTVIKCSHPESRSFTFHYGPVFSAQSSKFYDGSRSTSYGWTGDSVTITGIDFRDSKIFGSVNCNFGELSVPASSVDSAGATVVCQVPNVSADYWNTLVDVSLTWSGGANTCPPLNAKKFHFGPTIRSITPTRGYVAGETPVTISGFAFGCCGISSYSCLFPPVTPPKVDDTKLYAANTLTCTVPKNSDIDVLINNIGVAFTSSLFGTQDVTFTEDQTSLKYYYGPSVNSYTPSHSTLSGRDQFVVIEGEGFDDPFLLETFCDFFNETSPGFEFVPIPPLEEEYITATTITCPIPLFSHYAGAVDMIRPRWRRSVQQLRPELGKYYYKTAPPTIVDSDQPPYFSDGGSNVPVYLEGFKYGPVITSVCVGSLCNDELPRSSVDGGLTVTVSFDSLRDFVSSAPTKDFGSQTAICVFGDRLADEISVIVADPNRDTDGYVTCTTPAGDFNFNGEISVLLNPLIAPTTFSSNQFHNKPYTTGVSRNWVSATGFETIVIYGSGFCQYSTVICSFSNGQSQSDATQGDITNDKMVTCRTPARPAGYSYISLQFCSPSDFETCSCDNANDLVNVPDRITFYGINSVSPIAGSLCGGTVVSYSGYGFSAFERITCSWPNTGLQTGNIVNDNLFTCNSVDISPVFDDNSVHCSDIKIIGYRNNLYHPMSAPSRFESGFPQLIAVNPSTISMTSISQIVAKGLYFNGNGFNVNCLFSGFTPSRGTLVPDSNGEFSVICLPPANITVGTYDFSLSFGCSSGKTFTTDNLHFTITQTPVIQKVRPIAGPEIGGQTVTISGYNFNGGSLYLCFFGKIAVGATYNESLSQLTCKSPAFLEANQDVKIPLYISLDGGKTLFRAKDDYIYQNIVVVQDGNVCVNQDINEGSHLSVSLFVTILFVCISFLFF